MRGLFGASDKNLLAGFFVVLVLLALSLSLYSQSAKERTFYCCSFVVLSVGTWYSGSRGALVALVVGVACLGIVDIFLSKRKKFIKFVFPLCILVFLAVSARVAVGWQSDIVLYYSSLLAPTEVGTFTWRTQARWPHFIRQVRENPILGVGTDVDRRLGRGSGKTPHNGYLYLAVKSGIPALLIFLGFLLAIARKSLFAIRRATDDLSVAIATAVIGILAALSVHNLVDATFQSAASGQMFWILFGLSMATYLNAKSHSDGSPNRARNRQQS